MVRLWGLCRSGMGGYARLPDEGGSGDQCAWLLDAFEILSDTERRLPKE